MSRRNRTIAVVLMSLTMATVAAFAMYQVVQRLPVREVEVANYHVVVAAKPLTMGTRLSDRRPEGRGLAIQKSGCRFSPGYEGGRRSRTPGLGRRKRAADRRQARAARGRRRVVALDSCRHAGHVGKGQ